MVLVVDNQEWSARSLESVLAPKGFATLREFTGAKALERATAQPPDIVILAKKLPDTDGVALCTAIRNQLGSRVPLLITVHEHPTRAERLAALRAGAWDVLVPPVDAEELLLRLEAYVRAKFDSDQIQETALLDARTGLYNVTGLERRATELGAWAQRQSESLSCVILGAVLAGTKGEPATAPSLDAIVDVLRKIARNSDAIGLTDKSEFAVVAPATDAVQAVKLAERLAAALREAGVLGNEGERSVRLRGGYDSVADVRQTPLSGPELIRRAADALAHAKAERNGDWLRPFHHPPASLA